MKNRTDPLWEKLWEDLEPEDLPGDLQEIAASQGMELARYLVEHWGGLQIYVHSRTTIEREYVEKRIKKEFDGTNAGELAARYGISRNKVYRYLEIGGGQMDLPWED